MEVDEKLYLEFPPTELLYHTTIVPTQWNEFFKQADAIENSMVNIRLHEVPEQKLTIVNLELAANYMNNEKTQLCQLFVPGKSSAAQASPAEQVVETPMEPPAPPSRPGPRQKKLSTATCARNRTLSWSIPSSRASCRKLPKFPSRAWLCT